MHLFTVRYIQASGFAFFLFPHSCVSEFLSSFLGVVFCNLNMFHACCNVKLPAFSFLLSSAPTQASATHGVQCLKGAARYSSNANEPVERFAKKNSNNATARGQNGERNGESHTLPASKGERSVTQPHRQSRTHLVRNIRYALRSRRILGGMLTQIIFGERVHFTSRRAGENRLVHMLNHTRTRPQGPTTRGI